MTKPKHPGAWLRGTFLACLALAAIGETVFLIWHWVVRGWPGDSPAQAWLNQPIKTWGRIGKVIQFVGGLTVVIDLRIIRGGGYRNGSNSSPVLARKPISNAGRYCIRLSRVFTSAGSSPMVCLVRFARDRFRCDHTGSTGFSSWA